MIKAPGDVGSDCKIRSGTRIAHWRIRCDVIAGPTTPSTAFPLKAKTDDPVAMYLNDIYTIPVNLAGLPGLSLPVGFDAAGLPIGMQLIGRYFEESLLLNVAHKYQEQTDWHRRLPAGFQ